MMAYLSHLPANLSTSPLPALQPMIDCGPSPHSDQYIENEGPGFRVAKHVQAEVPFEGNQPAFRGQDNGARARISNI
jgi:hypothetical protein